MELPPLTQLPVVVQVGQSRFAFEAVDEYASQRFKTKVFRGHMVDVEGRWNQFLLDGQFLLALADAIYRVQGREPRDQPLRVEVALAPTSPAAAAAPAPVLQLVPADDPEKEAIKARMLAGR